MELPLVQPSEQQARPCFNFDFRLGFALLSILCSRHKMTLKISLQTVIGQQFLVLRVKLEDSSDLCHLRHRSYVCLAGILPIVFLNIIANKLSNIDARSQFGLIPSSKLSQILRNLYRFKNPELVLFLGGIALFRNTQGMILQKLDVY